MNKYEVTPVPIRNIILRFNLLDWFQVLKMIFWINITYLIIAGIYLNFFKVLNIISVNFFQINLYEKEEAANNFITQIISGINQSGDNFLGGKFTLWFFIIYTCLLLYTRYEENKIEYTFKIPVLSYPLIFLISGFFFFFGFTFSEISGFYFFWLIFFVFIFVVYFENSKVFKTVYLREFPEEYKKDFGDSKP